MSGIIELRTVVDATMRWWWLLIVATLVGALIGRMVSQRQEPVYAASTTLLVGQSIQSVELDSRDIAVSEQLAQTYAYLARLQPVLEMVIEALEIDASWRELAQRVVVTPVEGTQLLKITVEAPSPAEAQAAANEIAEALISLSPTTVQNAESGQDLRFSRQRVEKLRANIEEGQRRVDDLEASLLVSGSEALRQELQNEIDVVQGLIVGWEENYTRLIAMASREGAPNVLTVVAPAQATRTPIRPRTMLNMFVVALAGFSVALALVIFRELQDDTIRSSADLSHGLEIASLGAIGHIRGKNKLITVTDPLSSSAGAYSMLRNNIEFRNGDQPPKTIMITSPSRGEGKSVTAANLGVAMAEAGHRTIVVDANLLHPVLHQIFSVPNEGGILDLLQSEEPGRKCELKQTAVENLLVVTRGAASEDSNGSQNGRLAGRQTGVNSRPQLRASHRSRIMAGLSDLADVVLFDSPSLLTSADALALSAQVDAVVLVLRSGRTRDAAVRQALASLDQGEANVLGGILNRASTRRWL